MAFNLQAIIPLPMDADYYTDFTFGFPSLPCVALSGSRFLVFASEIDPDGNDGTDHAWLIRADGVVLDHHISPAFQQEPSGSNITQPANHLYVRVDETTALHITTGRLPGPGVESGYAVTRLSAVLNHLDVEWTAYPDVTPWPGNFDNTIDVAVFEPDSGLALFARRFAGFGPFPSKWQIIAVKATTGEIPWVFTLPSNLVYSPQVGIDFYLSGPAEVTLRWQSTDNQVIYRQAFTVRRTELLPGPLVPGATNGPPHFNIFHQTSNGAMLVQRTDPPADWSFVFPPVNLIELPQPIGTGPGFWSGAAGSISGVLRLAVDLASGWGVATQMIIEEPPVVRPGFDGPLNNPTHVYRLVWDAFIFTTTPWVPSDDITTTYLRMNQRDDGLGISGHPRLSAGKSSTAAPRVGAYKKFI